MKDLKDKINESLTASMTLLAAATFFNCMCMIFSIGTAVASSSHKTIDPRNPFQIIKDDIKDFFKDKKLKKIADKYKDDPDIKEYLENPKKQGWRSMLQTKLDPEEIEYINSLTRKYFK